MLAPQKPPRIETLLDKGEWEKARTRIERELTTRPDDHWLLTQLGVTYYEQGQYEESVRRFLSSLEVVPDCPLTLWNLAGALDAIGKPETAIAIYTWLLRSKKTPDDDPCWESAEWTAALKTDCVYRLGVCFRHLKRWESAEHCFRQYLNLRLAGSDGTYSFDDAARQIQEARAGRKPGAEQEVRRAIDATLRDAGVRSVDGGRKLPKLSADELLAS